MKRLLVEYVTTPVPCSHVTVDLNSDDGLERQCRRHACVFVDDRIAGGVFRRYACPQHAKYLPNLAQAGAVVVQR